MESEINKGKLNSKEILIYERGKQLAKIPEGKLTTKESAVLARYMALVAKLARI